MAKKNRFGYKLTKVPPERVYQLIVKYLGNISLVAKELDCCRETIYNHIKKSKLLKAALDQQRMTVADYAEYNVFRSIVEKGDTDNSKWLLPKLRPEYYGDKLDIQHTGNIIVDLPDFLKPEGTKSETNDA
jgi:hypothetical protein